MQRLQFQPDSRLDDPLAVGKRPETAIGAGNHAFTIAHRRYSFLQPPRNHLWMFNDIRRGVDDARQKQHVVRKRIAPHRLVLMLMSWISELDTKRSNIRLVQNRQDALERDVKNMRSVPVSPTTMQPHSIVWDSLDRFVDRGNV